MRALADFETLGGFLDHVALVMENEESAEADRVSLMTLHAAKGLEFDTVFLPGWEEGLFPNQRALDESGLKGLEEERRLAYVGLTRARRRAIVSHAANRRIYANWQTSIPSRFVDELPDDHVQRVGAASLRAGEPARAAFRLRRPVPAGGAAAQGDRGLGAAGPAGARGCDPGRRARVPPEIRLRHRHPRPRTTGSTSNSTRRARSACSTASWSASRDGASPWVAVMARVHATRLETVAVDVPEEAVAAYEAALRTACGTVGFFRDEASGLWRVEGVKDAGRGRGGAGRGARARGGGERGGGASRAVGDAERGLARPHL